MKAKELIAIPAALFLFASCERNESTETIVEDQEATEAEATPLSPATDATAEPEEADQPELNEAPTTPPATDAGTLENEAGDANSNLVAPDAPAPGEAPAIEE